MSQTQTRKKILRHFSLPQDWSGGRFFFSSRRQVLMARADGKEQEKIHSSCLRLLFFFALFLLLLVYLFFSSLKTFFSYNSSSMFFFLFLFAVLILLFHIFTRSSLSLPHFSKFSYSHSLSLTHSPSLLLFIFLFQPFFGCFSFAHSFWVLFVVVVFVCCFSSLGSWSLLFLHRTSLSLSYTPKNFCLQFPHTERFHSLCLCWCLCIAEFFCLSSLSLTYS